MSWKKFFPLKFMRLSWMMAAACWFVMVCAPQQLRAEVTWHVLQTIRLSGAPIDLQVSERGNWIFALNNQGQVLIYTPDGQLKDTLTVGSDVDHIQSGPRDDILFLLSRKTGTVQVISFAFKESIDVTGSPFKGPASAPVAIVVFSDFQ